MKLNHVVGAAMVGATALAITFGATAARADYNGADPAHEGQDVLGGHRWLGSRHWQSCPKPEGNEATRRSSKKMSKK